jgi:hypothetical protein|nr:MAG TPA: hypothetical protein [Caudoviricetes sp.]
MRILSIGFGDKKKVKYEKANNAGITETYQLSTEDDFRPEILEPYVNARALVFEVFKVFKLFEEEWMKIKSISFKWHKQMPRVITEVKYVLLITNKKGDECTISTSWLPIEEETQDKLIPLVEEIELFVKGTRAQGKLWEEELADDAVDGETFHINDLVQEGKEND